MVSRRVKAVYRGERFVLLESCDLPDGVLVELIVVEGDESPVADAGERARILKRLTDRMRAHPIAPDAPRRLSREELHERR